MRRTEATLVSRPTYQTEADLRRELQIARFFERRFKLQMVKRGEYDHFDFEVRRGGAVGIAEVKRRFHPQMKYDTFMISQAKIIAGLLEAAVRKLQARLVICWDDAAGWIKASEFTHTAMGGRTDRGDPRDREMCCHYPMERFRLFWWPTPEEPAPPP